jgi:hypothetical protein
MPYASESSCSEIQTKHKYEGVLTYSGIVVGHLPFLLLYSCTKGITPCIPEYRAMVLPFSPPLPPAVTITIADEIPLVYLGTIIKINCPAKTKREGGGNVNRDIKKNAPCFGRAA